jgi:hypothetical protein
MFQPGQRPVSTRRNLRELKSFVHREILLSL